MRVLIADDDAVSRLLLRRILTAAGHEAVPFADGVRAWEAFRLEQFPVVISDWVMPGVDGLVHISQLAHHRVQVVTDEVKEGDEILVKVLDVDRQGKIRLSRKEAMPPPEASAESKT